MEGNLLRRYDGFQRSCDQGRSCAGRTRVSSERRALSIGFPPAGWQRANRTHLRRRAINLIGSSPLGARTAKKAATLFPTRRESLRGNRINLEGQTRLPPPDTATHFTPCHPSIVCHARPSSGLATLPRRRDVITRFTIYLTASDEFTQTRGKPAILQS